MKLKEFTCHLCGTVDLIRGGGAKYRCNPCRVAAGGCPGRTPQEEAHVVVARAVWNGDLQPARSFPCTDCGGAAIEYDHRDYNQPLNVDPVCRACNLRRGPAANHPTRQLSRRVAKA